MPSIHFVVTFWSTTSTRLNVETCKLMVVRDFTIECDLWACPDAATQCSKITKKCTVCLKCWNQLFLNFFCKLERSLQKEDRIFKKNVDFSLCSKFLKRTVIWLLLRVRAHLGHYWDENDSLSMWGNCLMKFTMTSIWPSSNLDSPRTNDMCKQVGT